MLSSLQTQCCSYLFTPVESIRQTTDDYIFVVLLYAIGVCSNKHCSVLYMKTLIIILQMQRKSLGRLDGLSFELTNRCLGPKQRICSTILNLLSLSLSISLSVSLGIVKLPEKHFTVETGLLAYEVIWFTQYKPFFPNCAKQLSIPNL